MCKIYFKKISPGTFGAVLGSTHRRRRQQQHNLYRDFLKPLFRATRYGDHKTEIFVGNSTLIIYYPPPPLHSFFRVEVSFVYCSFLCRILIACSHLNPYFFSNFNLIFVFFVFMVNSNKREFVLFLIIFKNPSCVQKNKLNFFIYLNKS